MVLGLGLGYSRAYKASNRGTGISLIGNFTGEMNGILQGSNGGRTDVMAQHRTGHYVGGSAASNIRGIQTGYYIPSTGGVTQDLGNDFINRFAIQYGATTYPVYRDGVQDATIAAGEQGLVSDPIAGLTIPAGGVFYHRESNTIADPSKFFPSILNNLSPSGEVWVSTAASNQVNGTAAISKPTGGAAGGLNSTMIVGKFATPIPSVIFVGDSIANGSTDTNKLGFLARGFEAGVGGYIVPWHRQTNNSWQYASAVSSPKIQAGWKYCTHIIFELGTNDIANGRTLADVKSYASALYAAARATIGPYGKRLKVYQTLILPRVNSTDSCATLANQTPITGFTNGSVRDQFNAWIIAGADGLLDGYINTLPAVEDPTDHTKWQVNGNGGYATADGVHPSVLFHTNLGAVVNTWAQTLTV